MDSSFMSLLSISDDLEAGFSGAASPSRHRRGGAAAEHFLDTCFFCKRGIGGNRDIFMYRGDTPFCSEICRQEQIEIDEAGVKRRSGEPARVKKVSTSMKSEIPVRTGSAVVVG